MTEAPPITSPRVAKNKKTEGQGEDKATIYVKIRASLKERFERVARENGRKLNAELERALEAHCRAHEAARPAEESE